MDNSLNAISEVYSSTNDVLKEVIQLQKTSLSTLSQISNDNINNIKLSIDSFNTQTDKYIDFNERKSQKTNMILLVIVSIICLTAIIAIVTLGSICITGTKEYFNYIPSDTNITNTNNNNHTNSYNTNK